MLFWRLVSCSYLMCCVLQEMKEMLYAAIEQVPAPEQVDPDSLSRYYAKFDEKFFSFCDKELAKINTFYSGFEQHLWFCLSPTSVFIHPLNKVHPIPVTWRLLLSHQFVELYHLCSCACYSCMNIRIVC